MTENQNSNQGAQSSAGQIAQFNAEQGIQSDAGQRATAQKLPFHSFRFSLIEGRQPRALFNLAAPTDGTPAEGTFSGETPANDEDVAFFKLVITKGSASNPLSSVKREIPLEVVNAFRDTLQELGVFGWEGEYGDTTAPGSRRWDLTLVFQKDVFSITAKGGSDVPARFDEFLEELYRMDFPRPAAPRVEGGNGVGSRIGSMMGTLGINSVGSMSSGDLGAYAATKGAQGDLSYLKGMFGAQEIPDEFKNMDLDSIDVVEMQKQFMEAQQNPEAFQAQMKDAYKHLPPEEKIKLLDMLAKMSGQSREWWRRLLEG